MVGLQHFGHQLEVPSHAHAHVAAPFAGQEAAALVLTRGLAVCLVEGLAAFFQRAQVAERFSAAQAVGAHQLLKVVEQLQPRFVVAREGLERSDALHEVWPAPVVVRALARHELLNR